MSNEAALIISLILGVLTVIRLTQYLYMMSKRKKLARIYEDKHQDFDSLLAQYNPYYKSLDSAGRDHGKTPKCPFYPCLEFFS